MKLLRRLSEQNPRKPTPHMRKVTMHLPIIASQGHREGNVERPKQEGVQPMQTK